MLLWRRKREDIALVCSSFFVTMSVVAAAPSRTRGELVLQPSYFTSSIFVKPLREDITTLIHSYHDLYTKHPPTQPFSLFRDLWSTLGWRWTHLMVFDDRPREMFLNVVHRLFLGQCLSFSGVPISTPFLLERMVRTEAPFTRAVALFGLYTFFMTQPQGTAPPLYSISHIPIPVGLGITVIVRGMLLMFPQINTSR